MEFVSGVHTGEKRICYDDVQANARPLPYNDGSVLCCGHPTKEMECQSCDPTPRGAESASTTTPMVHGYRPLCLHILLYNVQ